MASTTTAANLRIGVLKAANDYITGTVTTGTSSTVFIDTSLANYAARPPAPYNWVYWLTATQAGNAYANRLITTYASSTYTVTMASALTGTTTAADTYEISQWSNADLIGAINQARIELYPNLSILKDVYLYTEENQRRYTIPTSMNRVYQVRLANEVSADADENILDSESLNPRFEEWTSTTPDHWTATNLTTTYNTDDDFVWDDDYSCECLVAVSTTGTLTNSITNYAYYSGMKMSFKVMAYCGVASRLRASINDGTTTTYSSYHAGNGWEELTVSAVMQATPTAVTVGVSLLSGSTAVTFYLDEAILTMGQRAVNAGETPVYNWKQSDTVLELPYTPAFNQRIHLIGQGYLSSISSDTDTMEVSEQHLPLLYEQALVILYQKSRKPQMNTEFTDSQIAYHMGRVQELKRTCSMPQADPINGVPDWYGG